MRNHPRLYPAIAVLIACATGWMAASTSNAQGKAPKNMPLVWEHKIITGGELAMLSDPKIKPEHVSDGFAQEAAEKGLTSLGKEGWELASVQSSGGLNFWFFLKRPVAQ